ncbi:polyprenyl synthetase family protein [Branchiibius sp. NY16-3462-2]|uniref:polyprenyl synthetase family protein n=1 Tax=Branchiibius sp. NY16-3462-2 TaxID=1807500 RepID=UPI0007997743|nr:polyprenyl synthetase family protein [Branchiibius sp. NY16-3462-2]KYH46166.1 geranylgeranyl pyrophosphate synthase [Branchiibius sp. NY16-3462-2]
MSDLQAGLARVDTRLHEVVSHDDAFIAAASAHLLDAGGKRFRPMLTLLASELGDGINDDVIEAAVGVELTHLASLYHDDVMDEADVRRGVPSANATYDNATAILVGDLLFGRASEVIAGLGAEAVRIQAQTFVRLCQGQIQDERQAPVGADAMAHYLGVLADKTGSLISTAARYGAMFGGAPDKTVDVMIQYGELIGLIFQLADDVLDITSQSQQSGKVPGTDLREGVLTLPVLYLRESTDPADAHLLELTSGPIEDEDRVQEALTLLRAHPAVERARAHALQLADDAAGLLDPLPDSEAVQTLRALPYQVAGRSA